MAWGRNAIALWCCRSSMIRWENLFPLFFESCLVGVVGEAQPRELPAMMGIEEVAIGDPAVSGRRCQRRTAQHELVDHELAVIFAERAFDRAIARVGRVGAARPLPDDPESVVESAGASRNFPFHFA